MAPKNCATAVVSGARVYIPLHGIVDLDAEISRLNKEIAKNTVEHEAVDKKLSNPDFISKAKPEAIEKQRKRQTELFTKLTGLRDALAKTLAHERRMRVFRLSRLFPIFSTWKESLCSDPS